MSKKEAIDFRQNIPRSSSDITELLQSFEEVSSTQNFRTNLFKKSEASFQKIQQMTDTLEKPKTLQFSFEPSIVLIKLLRNPQITSNSKFHVDYIRNIKDILNEMQQHFKITTNNMIIVLYLHLIFAQVENIQDVKELSQFVNDIPKISKEYQNVNIMNVNCIMSRIQALNGQQWEKIPNLSLQLSQLRIEVTEQPEINILDKNKLYLSKKYIEYGMNSNGYLDMNFGAFLISKFNSHPILRYFVYCQEGVKIQKKYGLEYANLLNQYEASKQANYQKWYADQISSLINNTFSIEDVRNKMINGDQSYWVEKFLIGLLGWNQKRAEQATILLNAFYDRTDWQIFVPFNPVISQVGQKFVINYLIDSKANRHCLLICLKAPCMDDGYKGDVYSWHYPKMNEYTSDEEKYLWVQSKFTNFLQSGFYDWKLFQVGKDGRHHNVFKIFSDQKKTGAKHEQKIQDLKPVQGRFIVHPQNTRQMQVHELYMDSLSGNQNSNKVPHFSDVIGDIKKYSAYGIDCVYLMGVFERDTGQFQGGFKRPQASPMAVISRTSPCKMFGGESAFHDLVKKSNQINMKVIVDCTARVSSSRHSKKYSPYLLSYLDEYGKKYPFYGAQGRSIHYEDTVMLNYRLLDAWNLLVDQVLEVIQKYGILGIYLDNGSSWPNIFEINYEQMSRRDLNKKRFYTNQEIFQGHVVNKNKIGGYWSIKTGSEYPNPMFIKIIKTIWKKYPGFHVICQSFETLDKDQKNISAIISGTIPRTFKMPKAISQIVGINLHENGKMNQITPKNIITFKKWYQEIQNHMPRNSIIIQSTSSHSWPYPAFLFKKATWAFVDLIFFLPEIPMTFIGEHDGRAYRSKATSIFFDSQEDKKEGNKFKKTNSSFFGQSFNNQQQKISSSINATIRDPTQIKYLQQNFRREVGPQFGFDLSEIHKHYTHRRKLRRQIPLLTTGKLLSLSAEHKYGVHKNVLSFGKWNSKEIILISINFNETNITMYYNLNNLKYLFTKPYQSNLIIKLQDMLGNSGIEESYYTVSQFIVSRIQINLKAYQSMIWKVTIQKDMDPEIVYKSSMKRMAQQISANPPRWIYSSVFTNQLSYMLDSSNSLKSFVKNLSYLYEQFIVPGNLNFSLVISKTYDFWLNKNKLSKLFGIFKLIDKFPDVNETLKKSIKTLIEGNILGPIAFVTPQIGEWSTVGGLGVMVDELSKQLARLGQEVYIVTPYYEYNKKGQTDYLPSYGFKYDRNIKVWSAHISQEFGVHTGKYKGVNFIWLHNPQLFSKPYAGQGALYVAKQLVFFALSVLESFCQLKIFPSIVVTNDWMCGFVSAYVKVNRYSQVFKGTKFMHICHNLDPLYQGRLYPKHEEGDLNWLVQLPSQWYIEYRLNKTVINPSKCALETCDNWGTVSNSYKFDLLKDSPLSHVLWKHPNPFSFPNGVRKEQRISLLHSKTPGSHDQSKKLLQQKYFPNTPSNPQIPILTFIGRVTKQKGVHLIVDSVESLLHQYNFKVQFIVGGPADRKEQYSKYCSDRMLQLNQRYPNCFWSDPNSFFYDGPLCNIGSDYAMMPSLFEPGGIVQHQFFCGSTPVIAFRTGGLKDTVFQYEPKTKKGNGFNFMSYQLEDFKNCLRRAIQCFKNDKQGYEKLRANAFDSVVEEQDVAKGWNTQFYRLQNKIYIDWISVEKQIEALKQKDIAQENIEISKIGESGQFWSEEWDTKRQFRTVLKNCQKLKSKQVTFTFETEQIPRPKDVCIAGSWDDWKVSKKMIFERTKKNWTITFKVQPGIYYYKYVIDGQWVLNKNQQTETDLNNIENHIIIIQ